MVGNAQHALDQGLNELLDGDDGGHRVTGDAEEGLALDVAENYRFAGHDGHPVDQQLSQILEDGQGVVLGTGRRPADGHHHVHIAGHGVGHRLPDQIQVVHDPVVPHCLTTAGVNHFFKHVGIGLQHLPRLQIFGGGGAPVHQFRPGGDDQHPRFSSHRHPIDAARDQGTHAVWGHLMAPGVEQFGGHDVFTHFAHVLPGKGRCFDADSIVVHGLDLLDHDHRIGALGHDVAGVEKNGLGSHGQLFGSGFAGTEGLLGFNGSAVHGRGVKVGRRHGGGYRFGQDPAHGVGRCHGFGGMVPVPGKWSKRICRASSRDFIFRYTLRLVFTDALRMLLSPILRLERWGWIKTALLSVKF